MINTADAIEEVEQPKVQLIEYIYSIFIGVLFGSIILSLVFSFLVLLVVIVSSILVVLIPIIIGSSIIIYVMKKLNYRCNISLIKYNKLSYSVKQKINELSERFIKKEMFRK